MTTSNLDQVRRLSFDGMFALEALEDGRFRTLENDGRQKRVFGGQLLGQALASASRTVARDRPAHMLQVQFQKPGMSNRAFDFAVDRLSDGRRFSSRHVTAEQDGRVVLRGHASFSAPERGLQYSAGMPSAPPPETLMAEQQRRETLVLAAGGAPAQARALEHLGFEVRPVIVQNVMQPKVLPPLQQLWLRPLDAVPDCPAVRQSMIAYLSDIMMLSTALHPHGFHWVSTPMDWASLNHSLWFHDPTDFGDWLLWDLQALWTGEARALVRGCLFDREGRLIASAVQEGLMRIRTNQSV